MKLAAKALLFPLLIIGSLVIPMYIIYANVNEVRLIGGILSIQVQDVNFRSASLTGTQLRLSGKTDSWSAIDATGTGKV